MDKKEVEKKPPPILLTKAEALDFAAGRLEEMAHGMELAGLLIDITDQHPMEGESSDLARKLKIQIPEPEIQARVAKQAAASIRELALEERLVSARTVDRGMAFEKKK